MIELLNEIGINQGSEKGLTWDLVESVALAVRWVRKVQRQICRAVARTKH